MTRLIAEAWIALQGVFRLLAFQADWEWEFDTSLKGLWHSFGAAIISLPLFLLILLGGWHIGSRDFLFESLIRFSAGWLIFPIAAALVVRVLGASERFVPWIVLHNWSVVYLYGLQAAYWMLFVAGIIDQQVMIILYTIYAPIRLLVHWRIAYMSLGVPTITSAMGAAVPVIVAEITMILVGQAFDASAAG